MPGALVLLILRARQEVRLQRTAPRSRRDVGKVTPWSSGRHYRDARSDGGACCGTASWWWAIHATYPQLLLSSLQV